MKKKPLSIDELARRLRKEYHNQEPFTPYEESPAKGNWRRVARLARKLFAPPAPRKLRPKKPKPLVCEACGKSKRNVHRLTAWDGKRFYSCERCWWHTDTDVFDRKVADHRAKAAAKKARKGFA